MSVPDPDELDDMDRREQTSQFKKVWLATLVLSAAILGSVFVLYPDLVVSSLGSAVGMGSDSNPAPENETRIVEYTGTWEGSFGPTVGSSARSIEATVNATVNFDQGTIVGEISGEKSSGSFSGTVYHDGLNGTGEIQALQFLNAEMTFEGSRSDDWSRLEGEWNTSSNLQGSGTWKMEARDTSNLP